MNYLAHAYLSNNNVDLLVGNFIADHVRGNQFDHLSKGIIEGIKLHRRIDTYTDAHPLFKQSKRAFYDGYEKYSGILVDIYFDHLLAKDFGKHAPIDLSQFSKNVYQVYCEHEKYLPESSSRFLAYVIKNNIYQAYGTKEGIAQVLYHLSHRIGHKVPLHESTRLFEDNITMLQANFDEFIKDLKKEFLQA
jgi:acyl carrier protein phosphodiesterase